MAVFFHHDRTDAGVAKSSIVRSKTSIEPEHQERRLTFRKRDKLLRLSKAIGEWLVDKGRDTLPEQQLDGRRMCAGRRVDKGCIERCGRQRLLDARMQMWHAERASSITQHLRIARRKMHVQLRKSGQYWEIGLVSDVAQSRHQYAHHDLQTVSFGSSISKARFEAFRR